MRLLNAIRKNPMIDTFLSLKGNARACIWLEPLWGLPYNLYIPYMTLFMSALGLSAAEIGYVSSITLVVSIFASVLSGVMTDKLGRRLCTLIFDTLSWSVPELIWLFSQNFAWFAVAAVFNGFWRVTMNSWGLLLIEGTDEDLVVRCFSLTSFMGLMVAFIAPLSKVLIGAFGLVPTMRFYFGMTCVMMTTKFVALYFMSHETEMGKKRMEQTKNQSVWSLTVGCWPVFKRLIMEKRMLLTLGLSAIIAVIGNLNSSFWALYLRDRIGVLEDDVVLFTTFKSLIMLSCILFLVPRLRFRNFRKPVNAGWILFLLSQTVLLLTPSGAFAAPVLLVSIALEAVALSVLNPMLDSLLFINADPEERARVLGLVYGAMLLPVSVFPAIAGRLAVYNIAAPFLINIVMFLLGVVFTVMLSRMQPNDEKESE